MQFVQAADYELLPPSGILEAQGVDLRVKTANGATFASPIGLASGLLCEGRGIDNIFSSSGIDSGSGLSTFIEIGTCTPEK